MSGILDSKTRVLDTIVTVEGRRQLATGGLNIRYVTFTDSATFYAADVASGSADATVRTYLESCNLPQDQITFAADDLGRVMTFDVGFGETVNKGQLHQLTFVPEAHLSGNVSLVDSVVTGSELLSRVDGILSSSLDNFTKLQTIATIDGVFDDSQFALSNDAITFNVTNDRPISKQTFVVNENELPDLIDDPRLSKLANFKCLPPTQRSNDVIVPLGLYTMKRGNVIPTHDDVIDAHRIFTSRGYSKVVKFDPTSRKNNLMIQAFESSNDMLVKLDVIDFGIYTSSAVKSSVSTSNSSVSIGRTSHIFFVGKLLMKQETHTHTFVHLFTLIFG